MPASLTPEEQKYIKGVQANLWTEYIATFPHAQYMVLPRWAALCEIQWSSPEKKNYADFLSRLPQLIKWYDAEGYNYAKHAFGVKPSLNRIRQKERWTLLCLLSTMPLSTTLWTAQNLLLLLPFTKDVEN